MIACTTGSLSAASTLLSTLTGWSWFNFDKISRFHRLFIFSLPRCSAPNKTADYQKIYSDWWEMTKCWKNNACQNETLLSMRHQNLIPLIEQTAGKKNKYNLRIVMCQVQPVWEVQACVEDLGEEERTMLSGSGHPSACKQWGKFNRLFNTWKKLLFVKHFKFEYLPGVRHEPLLLVMISFLLAPVVPFLDISPQNSFRILKTFRVQNPQEEEFRLWKPA